MRKPIKRKKGAKVKNVVPKEYAGIAYKSSLEAYTAKKLTEAGIPVRYEEISFPLLDAFVCPGESHEFRLKKNKAVPLTQNVFGPINPKTLGIRYTPDFCDLDKGWVLEVKGVRTDSFLLRWKLFRSYLQKQGLAYTTYMPNNQAQVDLVISHLKANFYA